MSNQQTNQRLRRNGSPSTKQGPIRATQQFVLTTSPSRGQVRCSPTSSPGPKENGKSWNRPLSETGLLNGRRSPSSPCGFRIVEKPKPIIAGRSNSVDNVMAAPYLSGQWPKDGQWQHQKDCNAHYIYANHSALTCDKQTQTPDDWDESNERRRSTSKASKSRSQSLGSGDQQQLKNIKHKLLRNGAFPPTSTASYQYQQRLSPVFPTISSLPTSSSMPIKIPTATSSANGLFNAPRGTPGKARASVEGLNQEVEKLIISGRKLDASECPNVDNMDGHRAPVYELLSQTTRSIDTQTPNHTYSGLDNSSDALPIMLEVSLAELSTSSQCSSEASPCSSRADEDDEDRSSQSVSPSFIPGQFELEESSALESNDVAAKMSSSPTPNSEFVRQPPDGAEKVKMIDELTAAPPFNEVSQLVPSKPLQPSATSAFHYLPLCKRNIDSSD